MWKCPKCNENIEDQFDSCWKCAGPEQPFVNVLEQEDPRREVPRSFCILTFVGMFAAAMFFVVLLGGAKVGDLIIAPLFPIGLLIGLHKIISWHSETNPTQQTVEFVMALPYMVYFALFYFFCFISKWRWYWVGFTILFCLLLLNIAGCHAMLKTPFHGPE
jgi:peptidoglycan/LPS O-acetylase OafA/YrhL